MNRYALTLKPVLAAIVLGACSTTPDMPKDAWKIAPVQTVRHGGASAAGYFALGRVKEGQGASTQAIEAYRKAISADPAHAAAWNALGALQMQLGRTDEGLQALERAVSLAPTTSHLHNNLGYALLLAARDDDAAKALRRAVELDGGNRRAWSNLATAYRRLGALDQAEFAEARASGRWPAGPATPTMTASTSQQPSSQPSANSPTPVPQQPAPVVAANVAPTPAPTLAAPVAPVAPKTLTSPPVTVSAVLTETSPAATPIAALAPAVSAAPATAPAEPVQTPSLEAQTAALGFATVTPASVRTAAAPLVTTKPSATLVKVAENVFELRNAPTTTAATAIAEAAAIIAAVAPPAPAVARPPVAAGTTPVAQAPAADAANRAARYEIANGHGGEGLARRLAGLLGQQGFARPRLTNQAPYNQASSVIQYRDGYRASAEAFASQLPFRPTVQAAANGDLRVDVRLVLGRDLTTSDACAVLGLCARVAQTRAPKLAAARGGTD
uniref:Tetratricopeptide repeat protein n=2 Tax=Aromatoleum toluolicum TaxID=90060 RepID=A0ABX1NL81_9RHOO|nr:tetratricopeptide repeat protein [Aromatoleum toluolicum]